MHQPAISIEGVTHVLPPMTVDVAEKYEEATERGLKRREKASKQLSFALSLLPPDAVAAACGGYSVEAVDVVALSSLCDEIMSCYEAAPEAEAMRKIAKRLETLSPVVAEIERISRITASLDKAQGFTRVS